MSTDTQEKFIPEGEFNFTSGPHCCVCEVICFHVGGSYYCDVHDHGKSISQGWICPKCGVVNSPQVTQCPCTDKLKYLPGWVPSYPYYPYPHYPYYPDTFPYNPNYTAPYNPNYIYLGIT